MMNNASDADIDRIVLLKSVPKRPQRLFLLTFQDGTFLMRRSGLYDRRQRPQQTGGTRPELRSPRPPRGLSASSATYRLDYR
jgi:hypothetical protein